MPAKATTPKVKKAPRKPKGRAVQMIATGSLSVHPLLDAVPMRPEIADLLEAAGRTADAAGERERWEAFCADVGARGVDDAISFVRGAKGVLQIIKGRHRWRASAAAGRAFVPAIEEPADKAREIILGEAGHRLNHVSKETAAYLAVMFYPHLAAVSRGGDRREQTAETAVCLTRSGAATMVGCSLRLIEDACATYKALAEKPSMKAKLEPLIVSGQLSLGAARAGAAGGAATGGGPRRPSSFASVNRTLRSLTSQVREFGEWPDEDRAAAAEALAGVVTDWPLEFLDALTAALEAAQSATAKPNA